MKTTISVAAVSNFSSVVNLETNLLLVKMEDLKGVNLSEITEISVVDENKLELLNEAVTWRQWGYGASIPNGYLLLKIKRFIPKPTGGGKHVEFNFEEELNNFANFHLFKKESVVLAMHYLHDGNKKQSMEKLASLVPGDLISIRCADGESLFATILSGIKGVETKAVGRISTDYTSFMFELTGVDVA